MDLSRHGRFGNGGGRQLYQVLKLYAIQSAYHLHDLPTEAALGDYQVTLWYNDDDGDKIMIGSAAELKDVLRTADGSIPPVVKIMAEVEPSRATAAESRPEALQHVVDSIVGVLGPAIVSVRHASEGVARGVAAELSSAQQPPSSTAASSTSTTAPTPPPKPAPVDRPFIHGRHTCDGCLTTPIVGERYHATNLPDYDLCARCKGNYQGNEITFEVAELGECPRRISVVDLVGGRTLTLILLVTDRDRPFQERWYRRHARWNQGRPCGRPRGPHGPMRHHHHPRHRGFGCPAPHAGPSPEEVDQALKEAIRRSLQDVKKQEAEKAKPKEEKAAATEESKPAPTVETVVMEDSKPAAVVPSAPVEEPEVIIHPTLSQEPEIIVEPRVKHSSSTECEASAVCDSTFELDAEGNGEIAAVLGATLDKVAEAIDAMNVELSRVHSSDDSDEDDDDTAKDEEVGAKIVDGEEEAPKDDVSNGSWHDVADDEQFASDEVLARAAQVIGSALFSSDMAHSNGNVSTLSRSHHSASSSSSSSSSSSDEAFSSVGSVPTEVPSLAPAESTVSACQRDRWAAQLQKLHEIGFQNDALLVDTIERLYAANIGCDEEEEVTVQQVVEELMKGL